MKPARPPLPAQSLDEIAQDPAKTSGLPMDAAKKLLAQAHVAEGALLARLLTSASTDGHPEAPAEEDRLLTPAEAAARLGVRRSRIYGLTRTGALPAVRVGKYVRVRAGALAQWVTEQEKILSSGLSARYNTRYEGQGAPAPPQAARADARRVRPAPGGPLEHAGPGRARRAPDSATGRQARPVARRPTPAPPDDDTDETRW